MVNEQSPDEIRKVAADFDKAVANKDLEKIFSSFAEDCEIELPRQRLNGKGGVKKWIDWLYRHLDEIEFEPIIIMVEGNIFFEEFIVKAKLHNGVKVESKQAEVLLYENYKIKSLRLYFDRLDFAESITTEPISKIVVKQIVKKSLKGLT